MRRILVAVAAACLVASWVPPAHAGGGGGCHQSSSTTGSETTVVMSELCFMPTVTSVRPGTTVTWVNKDSIPHTVTGMPGTFDSEELGLDGRFTHTFAESGTYAYYCVLHRRMAGAVVVGGEMSKTAPTGSSAAEDGNGGGAGIERSPDTSNAAVPLAGIGIPTALVAGFFVGRRVRHGAPAPVTAAH